MEKNSDGNLSEGLYYGMHRQKLPHLEQIE